MDRIDIQLWIHPVPTADLIHGQKGEPSAVIARRVRLAREIQQRRFAGSGIYTNAEMSGRDLERFCPLDDACKATLEKIIDRLGLSARAYTRIIKFARTIADLRSAADALTLPGAVIPDPGPILPSDLLEAASYRFLDRNNLLQL